MFEARVVELERKLDFMCMENTLDGSVNFVKDATDDSKSVCSAWSDDEPCREHNNVFCHLCDFEGDRQNDPVTHMKEKLEKEMITPLFDGKATNDTEAKKTPKYPSREWVVKKAAIDVKNCEVIDDDSKSDDKLENCEVIEVDKKYQEVFDDTKSECSACSAEAEDGEEVCTEDDKKHNKEVKEPQKKDLIVCNPG